MTLRELADRLGCRLDGDGSLTVQRVAALDEAVPGDVSFLTNRKYASLLPTTRATAVIVGEGEPQAPCATLRTATPYVAFARAIALLSPEKPPAAGVSPQASVASDVRLGEDVSIGPFAVIGDGVVIGARTAIHPHAVLYPGASVGDDCVIHAHVSIRERCRLGNRVIVQNGAVIGSDGYGFAPRPDGTFEKIPQVAVVVIEDDVEIGANTTIDRPALGQTLVESGTKIDNLVQIAHGVHVGKNVLLASQVGISGSTTVGDSVVLAGQVGVAGHIQIGRGTRVSGQTGVTNTTSEGAFLSGTPAVPNMEWRKASVLFRRLPELRKTISDLERRLADLESRLKQG